MVCSAVKVRFRKRFFHTLVSAQVSSVHHSFSSPSSGVKSVKIREAIMKGISLSYVQSVLKKMTNGRNCKVTWIVLEPSTSFSMSTKQSESVTKYKF